MSSTKSSTNHREGIKEGLFCSVAPSNSECNCGNNYVKNAELPNKWAEFHGISFYTTKQISAAKGAKQPLSGEKAGQLYFEAHHLISVSPVTEKVIETIGKNQEMDETIRSTDWCVNNKSNMYPMPKWGHTVYWYERLSQKEPPDFANVPQHDWSHDKYLNELKRELTQVFNAAADGAKNHEEKGKQLATDLNRISGELKSRLEERGGRSKGTHLGYFSGDLLPFSMASDNDTKVFKNPSDKFKKKFNDWTKRLGVR